MMMSESTCCLSASMPTAATFWRLPSKANGLVTTATVSMPMERAISATTGAAPVPVPPPIPAVMKSMSAPWISSVMRSRSSSAASRPTSGLAPAPRPLVTVVPSCSVTLARLRLSACASVFIVMNSTPLTPLLILWSTAFPPQPPTPTTLITASGVWLSNSSIIIVSFLEIPFEPALHLLEHLLESRSLHLRVAVALHLLEARHQQSHARRVARVAHHLGERSLVLRHADAHRHVEDLLAQLHHSLHLRRAPGDHDPGGQELLQPRGAQLALDEGVELLHPRLDHLGERLARKLPRAALAHAGHLDHVGGARELAERHPVGDLQVLGVLGRGAKRHGDVVGDLVACDGDHRGVLDRALGEDREVRRAPADVHEAHAQVALVVQQHGVGGSERLQHEVAHLQPAAAHALHDV